MLNVSQNTARAQIKSSQNLTRISEKLSAAKPIYQIKVGNEESIRKLSDEKFSARPLCVNDDKILKKYQLPNISVCTTRNNEKPQMSKNFVRQNPILIKPHENVVFLPVKLIKF